MIAKIDLESLPKEIVCKPGDNLKELRQEEQISSRITSALQLESLEVALPRLVQ